MTITINGKPIEQYLKIGQFSDQEKVRKNEIKERTYIHHVGIGKNEQIYDVKPSNLKIYSKGDIHLLNLQPQFDRIKSELDEEAKLSAASFKKLFSGILLLSEWQTTSQINKGINEIIKNRQPYNKNTTSSLISSITSKRLKVGNLIEKKKIDGKNFYHFFPSAVHLHLSEFRDLFSLYSSISIDEILKRIPQLKEEILAGEPLVSLKEMPKTKKIVKSLIETQDEIIVDGVEAEEARPVERQRPEPKPLEKMASILDQHLIRSTSGSEIKITVNFTFEAIRVLFGFER